MLDDRVIANGRVLHGIDELVVVTVVTRVTYFVIDVVTFGGQLSSEGHGAHLAKHNKMTVFRGLAVVVDVRIFIVSVFGDFPHEVLLVVGASETESAMTDDFFNQSFIYTVLGATGFIAVCRVGR